MTHHRHRIKDFMALETKIRDKAVERNPLTVSKLLILRAAKGEHVKAGNN